MTFTFRVVFFAAARAGVAQCSQPLGGGGQHCVTPARAVAKESTVRAIQEKNKGYVDLKRSPSTKLTIIHY